MKKTEVKKRCKCAGLFLVWYWYYRRYPTTLEMFELSSDTISYLDDIICSYEVGELIVADYNDLAANIERVIDFYKITKTQIEMIILRGDKAITPAQKKLITIAD